MTNTFETCIAFVVALVSEPRVTAAIRAAVGPAPDDECLPLAEAAPIAGIRGKNPTRTLRAALLRHGIAVEHVGGKPVVRRADLRRLIEAARVVPTANDTAPDERDDARAAIAAAARRYARSS